jgi:hypothetical protein
MADTEEQEPDHSGLVFAAHNNHDPRCGRPPRPRNTANPGLYYGYFENRYGEQIVFIFDRHCFGRRPRLGRSQGVHLGLLDVALRSTRDLATQVEEREARSRLPVIDAALALGRLTGLTGKDEVIWLRACLAACTGFAERPDGGHAD